MPRRKLPEDEKLSENIMVSLSPPQKRLVDREAKARGIKPATLVREATLASIEKQNR